MSGSIKGRVASVRMDRVLGETRPNLEKIGTSLKRPVLA